MALCRNKGANRGYRDRINCSVVIFRGCWGTLLGNGRWMGNRSDRIDYCRSRDRVSIEWLSWKARSADLIDKGTYVKSTSASVRHRTHGASSVFAFRPRQEYRRAGERGAGYVEARLQTTFFC